MILRACNFFFQFLDPFFVIDFSFLCDSQTFGVIDILTIYFFKIFQAQMDGQI